MTTSHIMVLAGGLSHEREVSLRSGSRLAHALKTAGHEVSVRDVDDTLLGWIAEHRPDAAVIALHGGQGEDGSAQAVLELVGVPFVGTRSAECRLAWDKASAKQLLRRGGYSTPNWVTVSHSAFRDLGAARLVEALGTYLSFPLLLKPYQGGSALGVTVVRHSEQMPAALIASFAYCDVLLAEEYVVGSEVSVTVIDEGDGPVVLPAVEIVSPGDVFDYEARYTAGTTTYHTPARLPDVAAHAVADLALGAHHVLGLRDVSRTDAIVTPDGIAHFLEVNVSPGLTETSLLPMAVDASGRELGEVYGQLIERAIERERVPDGVGG